MFGKITNSLNNRYKGIVFCIARLYCKANMTVIILRAIYLKQGSFPFLYPFYIEQCMHISYCSRKNFKPLFSAGIVLPLEYWNHTFHPMRTTHAILPRHTSPGNIKGSANHARPLFSFVVEPISMSTPQMN